MTFMVDMECILNITLIFGFSLKLIFLLNKSYDKKKLIVNDKVKGSQKT